MSCRFVRTTLIGLVALLTGCMSTSTAFAQESNLESAALLSGRVIGAARACGINAERLQRTSDRLISVVASKASSEKEKNAASAYFIEAQASGAEQVRAERSLCPGIHVSFSEIEAKLGRAPVAAAKQGVPALGALRSNLVTRTSVQ